MSKPERLSAGEAEARVVMVSAPEDQAERLARGLVESGLAACVQRLGGMRSTYRWEGRVQDEPEALLLIKTLASRVLDLEAWLVREHPYDVPECLSLTVDRTEPGYLGWMVSTLAGAEGTPIPGDGAQA